jgi:hypothetical protein
MFKGWRIEVESPVKVLCFGFVPDLQRIAATNVEQSNSVNSP